MSCEAVLLSVIMLLCKTFLFIIISYITKIS
nr:MAG TPA: hypothetical protein [Bacteriophage sp.]